MTIETFQTLIKGFQQRSERVSQLYKFGVDLMDFDDGFHSSVVRPLMKEAFGEDGVDWIEWFLYEKGDNNKCCAWDENGKEICYDVPSLFELVSKKGREPTSS